MDKFNEMHVCVCMYVCMYVKYVRIRCVRMQVPYVCKCSMYIRR